METVNRRNYLIAAFVTKKLTTEEAAEFRKLCAEDADFGREASEAALTAATIEAWYEMQTSEKAETEQNIAPTKVVKQQKVLRIKPLAALAYAAVLLMFMTLSVIFWNKKNVTEQKLFALEMRTDTLKTLLAEYERKELRLPIDTAKKLSPDHAIDSPTPDARKLLAVMDLKKEVPAFRGADSTDIYLETAEFEKAIAYLQRTGTSVGASQCELNFHIGMIAMEAVKQNKNARIMTQKAVAAFKKSADSTNCYDSEVLPSLYYLYVSLLLDKKPDEAKKYLKLLISNRDSENEYVKRAKNIISKTKNTVN